MDPSSLYTIFPKMRSSPVLAKIVSRPSGSSSMYATAAHPTTPPGRMEGVNHLALILHSVSPGSCMQVHMQHAMHPHPVEACMWTAPGGYKWGFKSGHTCVIRPWCWHRMGWWAVGGSPTSAVHMIRALSPANECTCANDGLWGMKFGLPTMGAAPIQCALTWGKLQPLA